jgi:hypothetical protein
MIKPRGDLARKLDNYSHRQWGRAQTITRPRAERDAPALTSDDAITHGDLKARRHVGCKVLVPLLITIVLLDVVQVVAAKDDGALHLVGHDGAAQNTATDGDLKGAMRASRRKVRGNNQKLTREKKTALTFPVKGHFLSMYPPVMADAGVLKPRPTLRT